MVAHTMKTTIELSDDLAKKAKAFVARKKITLRSVIEQGIREVLKAERTTSRFNLRDSSVDGRGLNEAFRDADWEMLRGEIYRGRGS